MATPNVQHGEDSTHDGLIDELGPIPCFPPRQLDAHGRLIPLSAEERKVAIRGRDPALRAIEKLPDDDPIGIEAEFMRGIDENRPEGRKIFEGLGLY